MNKDITVLAEQEKEKAPHEQILTDAELGAVLEELGKSETEDSKKLQAAVIKANAGEELDVEDLGFLDSEGAPVIMAEPSYLDISISEINPTGAIGEDVAKETFSAFGFEEEDASVLYDIMVRIKKGEKFSIYSALPEKAKFTLRKNVGTSDMKVLRMAAKSLMDSIIQESTRDQEFIDMDKALQKELGSIPTLTDAYLEVTRENMEIELVKKAEEVKDSDPATYERLMKSVEIFKKAYSFTMLSEYYEKCNKRRFHRDLVKYNRICTDYNYKNKDTKFKIYDIKLVEAALIKIFPDRDLDHIKKFIMLLSKTCCMLNTDDLFDTILMYYTNSLIINLGMTEQKTDFPKEIAGNILDIMDQFSIINNTESEE